MKLKNIVIHHWIKSNDKEDAALAIREWANCAEAKISGYAIWIANPQSGHWLTEEEQENLVTWLQETGRVTEAL